MVVQDHGFAHTEKGVMLGKLGQQLWKLGSQPIGGSPKTDSQKVKTQKTTGSQSSRQAVKPQDAFEEMERRLAQIQYYYRHSDLPLAAKQAVTYQKLLKLEYFTPDAAQRVLRDWHQKFS